MCQKMVLNQVMHLNSNNFFGNIQKLLKEGKFWKKKLRGKITIVMLSNLVFNIILYITIKKWVVNAPFEGKKSLDIVD